MSQQKPIEVEYWYDVEDHIDLAWFENYVSQIESFSNDTEFVSVDVWMRLPSKIRRKSFRSISDAKEFIVNSWSDIEETIIHEYKGKIRYSLLHHQHHYLRVRIDETSEQSASEIIEILQKTLKLTLSKPYPYKYRKSSIEFEVGHWIPKEFSAGVAAISKIIGPNPYLESAYVKSFDGEIERLTPFFTLDSFCEYLNRRASSFGEVQVQLRARSTTVGISSPTDHKKLRIRTSIPPEQVDPLIDAWPVALKLKQIKAEDTGNLFTGIELSKTEDSKWIKLGIPILVAFITAFSVTSAVSLKKAIWPEQNLVLISPKQEGSSAEWVGKHLEVDWYLQPEQPSFHSISKDVPAIVSLTDNIGQIKEVSGKPPAIFDVTPGIYNLVINVESLPKFRMQIKVKDMSDDRDF